MANSLLRALKSGQSPGAPELHGLQNSRKMNEHAQAKRRKEKLFLESHGSKLRSYLTR